MKQPAPFGALIHSTESSPDPGTGHAYTLPHYAHILRCPIPVASWIGELKPIAPLGPDTLANDNATPLSAGPRSPARLPVPLAASSAVRRAEPGRSAGLRFPGELCRRTRGQ